MRSQGAIWGFGGGEMENLGANSSGGSLMRFGASWGGLRVF